MSEEIK